jgi:hypothetical protein
LASGKHDDPEISFPISPDCAGDISSRLVAHFPHSIKSAACIQPPSTLSDERDLVQRRILRVFDDNCDLSSCGENLSEAASARLKRVVHIE